MRDSTWSTSQPGVEAPDISPAVFTPSNHWGSSSSGPSIWYERAPRVAARSARCFVFADVLPPTTTITSTCVASVSASDCRLCVSVQIVLTARTS